MKELNDHLIMLAGVNVVITNARRQAHRDAEAAVEALKDQNLDADQKRAAMKRIREQLEATLKAIGK